MDHCVTPGSSGSDTMLHLQSSSPSGATTIGRGSGSSSPLLSSTSRDLELDESHNNNSGNGGGSSRGSNSRRSGFCQVCPTCVCVCVCVCERERERDENESQFVSKTADRHPSNMHMLISRGSCFVFDSSVLPEEGGPS
jgi:hypothetical protein